MIYARQHAYLAGSFAGPDYEWAPTGCERQWCGGCGPGAGGEDLLGLPARQPRHSGATCPATAPRTNLHGSTAARRFARRPTAGSLDRPPVCDPNDEQACYNDGNSWDPVTCSCTYVQQAKRISIATETTTRTARATATNHVTPSDAPRRGLIKGRRPGVLSIRRAAHRDRTVTLQVASVEAGLPRGPGRRRPRRGGGCQESQSRAPDLELRKLKNQPFSRGLPAAQGAIELRARKRVQRAGEITTGTRLYLNFVRFPHEIRRPDLAPGYFSGEPPAGTRRSCPPRVVGRNDAASTGIPAVRPPASDVRILFPASGQLRAMAAKRIL